MAFSLIKLGTGERTTFRTKDLLALIGDAINDEITLKGSVYRLSSGEEVLEAEDLDLQTRFSWLQHSFEVEQDGQVSFVNPFPNLEPSGVFLTVNNILYTYGEEADFHLQDDRFYWHGAFELETTDRVHLRAAQVEFALPETFPTNGNDSQDSTSDNQDETQTNTIAENE